ncbi:hypothetical protein [Paraburkholderia rhynchosiae]|uniref:Uncharacterized protein n=1 Tax=Paraburkholderia rhynchosiae TaxID=487049 RepID=A0A2N7WQ92_9BURK|nr:hypothetical protein [Paraburkholderia rhynchosiae]PMS31603.1 hypothetical protein C0Z16_10580 [Paraburkholderia rhynchosiae]CAB3662750.1 hypothetical protein LMG27174_01728 [Paraburkholderia rhynchosiae]
MLRWLIAILFFANLLAFVAVRGAFGPTPTASGREPNHLGGEVHPDALKVRPVNAAEAADQAVVGAPAPATPIAASALPQ